MRDTLLPQAQTKMLKEGFQLGAIKRQSYDMKFTKALFTISDNRLQNITFNRNKTMFSYIDDGSQMLNLSMKNISFEYRFRYKVTSDPNYFTDEGFGTFFFKNMTLNAKYKMVNKNGKLEFQLNHTANELDNYTTQFNGTNDMAEGVTMVMDAYKPNFKKELTSMCSRKLALVLQVLLNQLITNQQSYEPITDVLISY